MATTLVAFGLSAWLAVDAGAATPEARPRELPLLPTIKGGPKAPPDRAYDLRRVKDGSGDLIYEAPNFTARVARDGTTTFQDHPFHLSPRWSLLPFAPISVPNGRPSLQSTIRDLLHHRKPKGGSPSEPPGSTPLPYMVVPPMSDFRPDPREACQYPRSCYFEPALVVGPAGSGDLTDEIMRFNGQDPYRHEKAVFLAATRDMRQKMGARAAAEDIRAAKADLAARMLAIACDERRSLRERRGLLEALRGELDGTTPEARAAAASVTRFIAEFFDEEGGASRCQKAAAP